MRCICLASFIVRIDHVRLIFECFCSCDVNFCRTTLCGYAFVFGSSHWPASCEQRYAHHSAGKSNLVCHVQARFLALFGTFALCGSAIGFATFKTRRYRENSEAHIFVGLAALRENGKLPSLADETGLNRSICFMFIEYAIVTHSRLLPLFFFFFFFVEYTLQQQIAVHCCGCCCCCCCSLVPTTRNYSPMD